MPVRFAHSPPEVVPQRGIIVLKVETLRCHFVQHRCPGGIDDTFIEPLGGDPDQIISLNHASIAVFSSTGLGFDMIHNRLHILVISGSSEDLVKVNIQSIYCWVGSRKGGVIRQNR